MHKTTTAKVLLPAALLVLFLVVAFGCGGGGANQPPGQVQQNGSETQLFVGRWKDLAPAFPATSGYEVNIGYSPERKNLEISVETDFNPVTDSSHFVDCKIDSINGSTLVFSYQSPLGGNPLVWTMTINPLLATSAELTVPGGSKPLVLTKKS